MQRSNNIEQLWYTWAPRGMEQMRGFQVYAASSSLMDVSGATFTAINKYLGYSLPTATDRQAATKENSPVCLAYINTGKQRFLLRKNFSGSDTAGRIGTYFIHLLASLPESFTARDAICLWASSFWQTAIPESESVSDFKDPHRYELWPLVPGVLKPEPHSERQFLQEETLAQYLPFTIQAYLSMNQDQRLFIAADDHQVASLVWGVTQCLPTLLQQDLTFSTYESDVLKADMRIVGTSLPAPEVRREAVNMARVLPTENYSGQYVTLNCYTGQSSPLASPHPLLPAYAHFASNCLLGRARVQEELQNLLASAERLQIQTVPALLFIYKFVDADNQSKTLSLEDISAVLENSNMALEFLRRDNVQEALINLATQHPQWWKQKGVEALTHLSKLRDSPYRASWIPIFTPLGSKVAQVVATAILEHDQHKFDISQDILCTVAPADKDPKPWADLFFALAPYHPDEITDWPLRNDLLNMWKYAVDYIAPEQIRPWLSISWAQLQDFSHLNLPFEWQSIGITQLLYGPAKLIPSWIVKLLEQRRYQQLFMSVLRQMCESQEVQTQLAARNFMLTLLKYGYTEKLVLFDVLLGSKNVNEQIVEELLSQAALNQQEQLTVFGKYPEKLLSLHSTSLLPGVQSMVRLYIDQFTVKTLISTNSELMLTALQRNNNKLSNELRHRVLYRYQAGQAICFGKKTPLPLDSFNETYLNQMGEAIDKLQYNKDKQFLEYLYYSIILTVWSANDKAKSLDQLLLGLRTVIQGASRKTLLIPVVKYLGQLEIPPHQLFPYIRVALEYTLLFKTAQEQGAYIFPLLNSMERLVQNYLDDIDAEAMKRWRPEIRNLWIHVSKSFHARPQSFPKNLVQGISKLNPLGRRDTSSMKAVKAEQKEQKSAAGETTKNAGATSESSNQRQEAVQSSQQPEKNSSSKVTEMPQQATDTAGAMDKTSPSTKTRSLQLKDIISINGYSRSIRKAWVETVSEIKFIYFPYIIVLMQKEMSRKPAGAVAINDEIVTFENQKVKGKDLGYIQQELIDDEFISNWIDKHLGKKEINKSIDKEVNHIIDQAKKDRQPVQKFGEEDLRKILRIYLRRFNVMKRMKKEDWDDFLKRENEKITTIEYAGEDWSSGHDAGN